MNKKEAVFGLAAAILLALLLSPFASPWPDGLEKTAERLGFPEKGEGKPVLAAPVPDYLFPGITGERPATALAGAAGTAIIFGLGYGLAALLKKRTG